MKPIYFFCLFLFGLLVGCKEDGDKRAKAPDVSKVTIPAVQITRYDLALRAYDGNVATYFKSLETKYPAITKLYFSQLIGSTDEKGKIDLDKVSAFLTDTLTAKVMDTVAMEYKDLSEVEIGFTTAFKYMKYYFPDFSPPAVYALTSNFNYQRFLFDDDQRDGMGIGLDMYMGNAFPYKDVDPNNPIFSGYLTRAFNRDHIVRNGMELLIDDGLATAPGVRLIDQMVYNGAKLYVLDLILPEVHDSIVMEYSAAQIDWCEENEKAIWDFFLDEKLLYETNVNKINKYVNASPNSPNMPEAAPGRTGNYIGYKIVEAYMRKFPKTQLTEILSIKDGQAFLEKARYRPK